jgi:hypothetical protein
MRGQVARARHERVGPWNAASRLNPASALRDHLGDAGIADALASVTAHTRDALENLQRLTAVGESG